MASSNIREWKPITLAKAYELLSRRADQEPGLMEIQSKTLDYLKEFGGSGDPLNLEQLVNELCEDGIDCEVAVNLVDICPRTLEEVFSILSMKEETKHIAPERAKEILDTLSGKC
ncbi:MAG: hypothetical protein LRS47_02845 [Desulfurococcales archaeon]|nr:hypothetical protein [Desulfurococcales archaeon]